MATWSHIQTFGAGGTGPADSLSATAGASVAAGDLLVVAIASYGAPTGYTVGDSAGNTYSPGAVVNNSNTAIAIYYTVVTTGGLLTVTGTVTGSGYLSIGCDTYRATGTISLDGSGATGTGTGAALSAGTITPSGTDLVYCAGYLGENGITWSPGPGFTGSYSSAGTTGQHASLQCEYILSQTAPISCGMGSNTSGPWACAAVAWQAASGGGYTPWIFGDELEANGIG